MGPLCTTDLQKACLLGYSLAQRFQLFMLLFFPVRFVVPTMLYNYAYFVQ